MTLLHIDAQDSLNLKQSPIYEPRLTAFAKKVIKPGTTAVDVGAHIGYYTTLFAELVGPSGRVLAFEPEEQNLQRLRLNTAACGNVTVYPCAVSDQTGMTSLYVSAGNSGDHRTHQTAGRVAAEVPTMRLDDVPDLKTSCIDFLKIDAQGAETAILRGARDVIGRSPHLLGIIEVAPLHLRGAGSSVAELLAVCDELGLVFGGDRKKLLRLRANHNTVTMRRVIR